LAFESQDSLLASSSPSSPSSALTKQTLTYGEFPLQSLYTILQRLDPPPGPDDVFLDLGSGCGRLTLGAALLYPQLKACLGVEVLPELHTLALQALTRAEEEGEEGRRRRRGEMSPCRFIQGNVETGEYNHDENPLSEATIIFMYSTSYRSEDGFHLARPLRDALLTQAHPEATIITTDKKFKEEIDILGGKGFRVVDTCTVENPEVVDSIVYFHKIVAQ
jgi:hypothetical protein